MNNQLQIYINQAYLRPWRTVKDRKEQSYVEGKPSQSHFDVEKLLRSRHCRAISGSSGRPFCVSFSLQGSRDLDEHDQISLVANWHCSDVLLSF
jgi:hypothetical protein